MDAEIYRRMAAEEEHHWWFVGRRKVLAAVLDAILPGRDAEIVELGVGTGGNLALLAGYGHVRGIEPDDFGRRHARDKGFEVEAGSLPGPLPFAPESADLVAMLDVLEHLDADEACLAAAAALLRPGGQLLLTVPAYAWLWSPHDERHHHKRRYRRGDIGRLAGRVGLKVVKSSHFNTMLMPVAILLRVAKKLVGARSSDDRMPPAALNRLFIRLLALEARWLARGSLPAGLSILAVLRRPV